MNAVATKKDFEDLSEKEQEFILALITGGGTVREAAEKVGYDVMYAYQLRRKLAKPILQATKEYFALNAPKAAQRVVKAIDEAIPNSINLQAAFGLLDRVGINTKANEEEAPQQVIKANIFILPAKAEIQAIDAEYEEVNGNQE